MDSRDRDQKPRHVGHSLSSLIVRPSDSGGGGGGGGVGGGGGGGASDYEPGEVRRENPSRSNRFADKNKGYGMHAGSISPLRQRKVDRHYGVRAGSVSPLRQRKVDKQYGIRADSTSPMHRRNVDKHCVTRVDSVSPLPQRTVDKHRVIRAGSVSPLHKRKVDHHYGMHPGSLSPLRQRNVDNYYRQRAGSISPLHQRNGDNHFGLHTGPISPLRPRKADHPYDSGFDHPGGPHRGRGFRGGRGRGRFRETSPPFGRGRGIRSFERGFDKPGFGTLQTRDEGIRNDPNVSPREGDWICSDPSCGNLNFARRAYCNNCNKLRFGPRGGGPSGSPRRRYIGPPSPRGPWPRNPGPPMNRGPERFQNELDSPPRVWSRDSPRSFGMDPPPPRHGGRFPDHIRRERPNYREDDEFRERNKLDILMPPERNQRGRGNGDFFRERRRYDGRDELQPPSPPPPVSYRDHWVHDGRERSRSPMRGGPKEYRRVPYIGRDRDDRRDMARMRIQPRY
ncbi:hypothetical protein MRB53_017211 [Persea americana]|uniref:Uncharacterized protein n=1 Tax=Persea americana TaxID=3435 RepID=A0ACC2M5R4_PERAE|nr:hypothetical protein MRB53_017211 [Persea americana]